VLFVQLFFGKIQIISEHIVGLLDWQGFESRVCGLKDFDVATLKKNTIFVGVTGDEPHVAYLWETLESVLVSLSKKFREFKYVRVLKMTPAERCAFLRFVWGRSRLPANTHEYDRKFEIHSFFAFTGMVKLNLKFFFFYFYLFFSLFFFFFFFLAQKDEPDKMLPAAHTCFFSLDLPSYTSAKILKEKLLYAINECLVIDTDYLPEEEGSDRRRGFERAQEDYEWDDAY